MKGFVTFILGVAVGAVGTYFATKKVIKAKCEIECQHEIDEYKKFVKTKVLKGGTIESHKKAVEEEKKQGNKPEEQTETVEESKPEKRPAKKPRGPVEMKPKYHDMYEEKHDQKVYDCLTEPIEITEDERDIYINDEAYTEIVLHYDIMHDLLYTEKYEDVVDDNLMEEIDVDSIHEHELGDTLYTVFEPSGTVFKIDIIEE